MTKESIESIYKDVLAGNRKSFRNYTWTKDNYGYDNFNRCLRYIVKKHNLTREQIVDIDHAFIETHKLRGGLVMLYNENIKPAIINAFLELDLKEWEFFRTSKNEEFAITALQEIVDRRGWTKDTFLEGRSNLYKDTDIRRIFNWLMLNGYAVVPFLKKALPDLNFTVDELTQRLSREKMKDDIKDTFENKLGWTKEDIINKMTWEIAKEHFPHIYPTYRNVLDMVRVAYPDILLLKASDAPLSAEIKELIILDVKAGHRTKDITDRYGIGRTTLTTLKRVNGLTKKPMDLTGKTFGRLTVIERDINRNKPRGPQWICKCECGEVRIAPTSNLVHNNTRSCGSVDCREPRK